MDRNDEVLRRTGDVVLFIIIMGFLLPFALIGAFFVWLGGLPFLLLLLIVLYVSLGAVLVVTLFNLIQQKSPISIGEKFSSISP